MLKRRTAGRAHVSLRSPITVRAVQESMLLGRAEVGESMSLRPDFVGAGMAALRGHPEGGLFRIARGAARRAQPLWMLVEVGSETVEVAIPLSNVAGIEWESQE